MRTDCINEVIVDIQKSGFSRMVFDVSRLVRIDETILRQMFEKPDFYYTFDYFRNEREVGDRTIGRKIIFVKVWFLEKWRDNGFFKIRMELASGERKIYNACYDRNKN